MGFLRFLCLALAGATVMVLCLLWVAQFFSGKGDVTPVIWIATPDEDRPQNNGDEEFAEWQK